MYNELTVPAAPFNGKPPLRTDARPHALVLIGDRVHEPEHIEPALRQVFDAADVTPHFLFDVRGLTIENLSQVKLLVIALMTAKWRQPRVGLTSRGGGGSAIWRTATRATLNHPMFQQLMRNAVNWCLRREN